MVWIYLIVQAVGFWIIAGCFETEDKDRYALTFKIGCLFSLLMVVVAAPLPSLLLTGFGVALFRSRINLTVADEQIALLSSFRKSLQTLTNLASSRIIPILRPMLEPLILSLTQYLFSWRQGFRRTNSQNVNKNIIDVEAIDVSRRYEL